MTVPPFQRFMLPALKALSDGRPAHVTELIERVVVMLGLSEHDLSETTPGGVPRVVDRTRWSATYLVRAGLLERVRPATFLIADAGRDLLAQSPREIGSSFLMRYPSFRRWKTEPKRKAGHDEPKDTPGMNEPKTVDLDAWVFEYAARGRRTGHLSESETRALCQEILNLRTSSTPPLAAGQWIPLSTYNPPSGSQGPAAIRFSDGSERVLDGRRWNMILVRVAEKLYADGRLAPNRLPIPSTKRTHLVSRTPDHPSGKRFTRAAQIGDQVWLELHRSAIDTRRAAVKILRHFGLDPAEVLLLHTEPTELG